MLVNLFDQVQKIKNHLFDYFEPKIVEKGAQIAFLDNIGVPYHAYYDKSKDYQLIIEVKTSIFPMHYHSCGNYNNLYAVVICNPVLIPSKFIVTYSTVNRRVKKIYVDQIHMNSKKTYKFSQDLYDVCINDNFSDMFFNSDTQKAIFSRIILRLNTWNFLDRQFDVLPENIEKVFLQEFHDKFLYQQKRKAWIKKTLQSRNQKFIPFFHF